MGDIVPGVLLAPVKELGTGYQYVQGLGELWKREPELRPWLLLWQCLVKQTL